jgi:tetratricopeptide (TPR) repeat protein
MVREVPVNFARLRFPRLLPALALAAFAAQAATTPPSPLSRLLRAFALEDAPGKEGDKAYRKGEYERALGAYARAQAETGPSALLSLRSGNALYRLNRFGEAAQAYGEAVKASGSDTAFAARAHYNAGNALYRKGAAADSSALDAAVQDLRQSVAHTKKSLLLRPDDLDAKKNLEIAQTLLKRLLEQQEKKKQRQKQPPQKPPEPSARAKEALARALQLAQERRYAEAKRVLRDILKADPTAAPYQEHLQRLDDVTKILSGQTPAAPAPSDPRARQKGLGL